MYDRKGFEFLMNILFLGDVVARSGREAVMKQLKTLQEKYEIDFTIINGENAAHGKGITKPIYDGLMSSGADIITLGNHAFTRRDIIPKMSECPYLLRPANMNPLHCGRAWAVRKRNGKRIAVMNLMGEVFMRETQGDPFLAADRMLAEIDVDIILVDFHAEATSEKMIFFECFKQDVTAVIGTHTHVQTADEKVEDGCAFISDAGMCGPYDSILGRDKQEIIAHCTAGISTHYIPAQGPSVIMGCVIAVDDETNRAVSIERIQIRP